MKTEDRMRGETRGVWEGEGMTVNMASCEAVFRKPNTA